MTLTDSLRLEFWDATYVDVELTVFRIASMYFPDDPEKDVLGLALKGGGCERCVRVNRKHERFHGTYDAIEQFINEFATQKFGKRLAAYTVMA